MTGHGHVTPNADGSKARCGGPGICYECSREQVATPTKVVKTTTRLVDELTTLLYEVLKRWEVEGRVCEIVQCGACRKKADKPSSVVHEGDCPIHRLWQALELGEVVVRANAEEICDLEDERDALEAKVNTLTAEMECRNELTARIAALEAERDALRSRAEAAITVALDGNGRLLIQQRRLQGALTRIDELTRDMRMPELNIISLVSHEARAALAASSEGRPGLVLEDEPRADGEG